MKLRQGASAANVGAEARSDLDDAWLIVGPSRPNTLLVGSPAATALALDALVPGLVPPVAACDCAQPLSMPTDVGTVVLRNVSSLSGAGQHAVLQWMDDRPGRVQVVALTDESLFALVERGAFLDALYYRLNVLSIRLE